MRQSVSTRGCFLLHAHRAEEAAPGKGEKEKNGVPSFHPRPNLGRMHAGADSHGGAREYVPRPLGEGVGGGDREAKSGREEGLQAKEALDGKGGF